MITAAPVIRKPLSVLGHPGLTDFTSIFIASELNDREYRTTLRHECGHVWAGHNRRRPKVCDDQQWKIACEMEIARNLYDQQDIETIESPRSRLKGAYLPDSIKGLPDYLLLAEEIYEWILLQPKELPESATCGCSCEKNEGEEEGESASIVQVRDHLDAEENSRESSIAAAIAYKHILNRPPSIVDCLDAALRSRTICEASYRRPSRRGNNDVILKGKLPVPRPPLVEIFVDRSGSFNAEKTSLAENALTAIISKYGASIRCDTWFFGNGKLSDCDLPGGGDTPYHLIGEHLLISFPKIAVIITDDDPVGDIKIPPKVTSVICIPIGSAKTNLSSALKGKDTAVIR